MDNLGQNNDVMVGGRKFHIETAFADQGKAITSTIFLDGQVIDSREVPSSVEPGESAGELIGSAHREAITDLEILYYIDEKVKAVRHAASANKLGLVFLQKNLYTEALSQFNLALEIDPGFSDVFANLGKTYLMNDSFDDAIETLKKGVQQAPHFADVQNYLGIAYLYKEMFEQAVSHLEEAINLNSNYIGAYYHLGVALLAKSQSENGDAQVTTRQMAMECFDRAEERMVNRQIANFESVMSKVKEQDYAAAINDFLLSKPKDVLGHFMDVENEFYLKFMYGGKGKDDSFISEYVAKLSEIISEHPEYADVRNNMGVANLIQCRNLFLRALDEFRAAMKINPGFKRAEKNLKLAENDGKGFLILLRAILK